MSILKYAVGIDVAKDTVVCCFGSIDLQQQTTVSAAKRFANTPAGFVQLLEWTAQRCEESSPECWFFMEASGVYYENLAFFLSENNQLLCVALPTTVRDYARSLNAKTKNDPTDAQVLTRMALERKLDPWTLPSPLLRQIKTLVRERQALVDEQTAIGNRLHALENSYNPLKSSLRRLQLQQAFLDKQVTQIEKELDKLLQNDPDLRDRVNTVATIHGVGRLTVLTVLAETNGFVLTTSAKQLVSYAGLDVVEHQSGRSHAPTHISKKGNARLRRALYMPALTAIQYNSQLKDYFHRLLARNGGQKKAALMAVARKLLKLIFTLFRSNSPYNPQHACGDAAPLAP